MTETLRTIPDPNKRYLIVGMSHTNAIAKAKADRPNLNNVAVINLRKKNAGDGPQEWPFKPDVVCLSIAGNQHNIITLFERPQPFTVGGEVFDSKPRTSIPLQMMKDTINHKNSVNRETITELHSEFPDAEFMYICAPPPISDTSTIRHLPELFEKMSKAGYAPDGLRTAVYKLQSDWYQNVAEENGAAFLPPPAEAVTDHGMLASEYCGGDPTHGNKKYGALVLDQILAFGAKTDGT